MMGAICSSDMDLYNIDEIVCPTNEAGVPAKKAGDAFLGGGTWLYSTPHPSAKRLIDLSTLPIQHIEMGEDAVYIGAPCTLAQLRESEILRAWPAFGLLDAAINALSSSFKVWELATLTGNVCLSLNKCTTAPVLMLLDASYELRLGDELRWVSAAEFQTGHLENILRPGEWLRRIRIPFASLGGEGVLKRISLTEEGSVVALASAYPVPTGGFRFVVSAATVRPVMISFDSLPTASLLLESMEKAMAQVPLYADSHGSAEYRRAMALDLLEQCRGSLQGEAVA